MSAPSSQDRLAAGARALNEGHYYDAHEEWECVWRELPASPARDRLKGLIQIAGALELRRKGRENAAARLALRALEHLAGEEGVELPTVGRLSVAGARALLEVLAREEAGGEVRALFCALT